MGKQIDRNKNRAAAISKACQLGCAAIMLGHGKFTLIDHEDLLRFGGALWHCHTPREYAVRFIGRTMLYLHRVILGLPPGRTPEVDHVNGDGLDNRKANLRICTRVQNAANSRNIRGNKKSKFKGVRFARGKWEARLKNNYKHIQLGTFEDERNAAKAYDACARKTWGKFAHTNF